jgi:hypothetical protein
MVSLTGAPFLTTGDPVGYRVGLDAGLIRIVAVIAGAGELLGRGLGLSSSGVWVHSCGRVGASTTGVGLSLETAQPADKRTRDRNRIRGTSIILCAASRSTRIEVR